MSDLEWFPLYVHNFLHSRTVRRMSLAEVGAYNVLLWEQWEGGPIADDDAEISSLCKGDVSTARAVLEQCFELTEDGWVNPYLLAIEQDQEEKRRQKIEAGRKGGKQKASRAKAELEQTPSYKSRRKEKKKRKESTATERKRSFPRDWKPNDKHQALATEEGVAVEREAVKFEDYAKANNRKYVDWDRAFSNWLRRAADFNGGSTKEKTYDDPAEVRLR